jgi:hypothetical protein
MATNNTWRWMSSSMLHCDMHHSFREELFWWWRHRVPDGHYTASRICDITSEKIKFFTLKTVRTLNDSSYNLINNCDCLHYCDVNTGNFFIFLLQFNTLHTSHSNTNILCTSYSNTQNPVHYFGLIHFVLQTQTHTVLCITSCSTQDAQK